MKVSLGALVEIPDELENFDVDENAKQYAKWYFENHFDWLKGLSVRWAKKHPLTTWEDCLRIAWERLPRILGKYKRESLFDSNLFIRSQLGYYWFTETYRSIKLEQHRLKKLVEFRENSADLVTGVEHKDFADVDMRDEHERHGVDVAIQTIVDNGVRQVVYAIVVLGITYREIAALLDISLATVFEIAESGFTEIYKANPKYYHSIYKTFRHDSARASKVAHKEKPKQPTTEQLSNELQQRIKEYWEKSLPS